MRTRRIKKRRKPAKSMVRYIPSIDKINASVLTLSYGSAGSGVSAIDIKDSYTARVVGPQCELGNGRDGLTHTRKYRNMRSNSPYQPMSTFGVRSVHRSHDLQHARAIIVASCGTPLYLQVLTTFGSCGRPKLH